MQLLLLPGMDGTGRLFEPLLQALPASLPTRVVPYPTEEPLSYAELMPLVSAAAAGLGEFVVVGESFSKPLALMLVARRPAGLRGVVLCASFVRSPLPRFVHPLLGLLRPWMFRVQPSWVAAYALLGRRRRGELGRMLHESLRTVSPSVMAARVRAVAGVDVSRELLTCEVPILYLQATEDRVVPRRCLTLIRAMRPDVEVAKLKGPHLILQAAADKAARLLESFCQRAATRTLPGRAF